MPSLVDRLLIVGERALIPRGQVAALPVVHAEYILPQKFGMMVAGDSGTTENVFAEENETVDWLRGVSKA